MLEGISVILVLHENRVGNAVDDHVQIMPRLGKIVYMRGYLLPHVLKDGDQRLEFSIPLQAYSISIMKIFRVHISINMNSGDVNSVSVRSHH